MPLYVQIGLPTRSVQAVEAGNFLFFLGIGPENNTPAAPPTDSKDYPEFPRVESSDHELWGKRQVGLWCTDGEDSTAILLSHSSQPNSQRTSLQFDQ